MELAAIFSVAKRFGMKKGVTLTVTDNLAEEKYVFSEISKQDKKMRNEARNLMFKIALNYLSK
jgi:purine-nucleoside phosphorylase